MTRQLLSIAAGAIALATAPLASATTIVTWETFGNAGNEPFVEPTNVAVGLVGLNLERGPGLSAPSGGNSFNSSAWAWLGGVRQTDDFVSFGFEVQAPFKVEETRLLFGSRSSNAGPGPLGLYWSGDNFTDPIHTWTHVNENWTNHDIDLSGLGILEADTYEFRIQSIADQRASDPQNTIAGGGTMRVGDYFQAGQGFSLFRFEGVVTPEPGRAVLLILGGVLLLGQRRRG